jgi:transposase
VLNPLQTRRYRDVVRRKAKTDDIDAHVIAGLVRSGAAQASYVPDERARTVLNPKVAVKARGTCQHVVRDHAIVLRFRRENAAVESGRVEYERPEPKGLCRKHACRS